jgi:hypothetical protein
MQRSKRRAFLWLLFMTLGWLLCRHTAHAAQFDTKAGQEPASRYQRPEDVLDLIPFLGDIPRTFLIGDGFNMKLSGTSLRIDHMGYRSKATVKNRDCMIGFSYMTPVAGFFTSRVDVPIFYSANLAMNEWAANSLGDYVAYFSKGASENSSFRLAISAKF